MKISLAAPSYTSRSVVAAVQQTMNLYPETVETPNEPARIVLYGRPGIKKFVYMASGPFIRGLWAGGGRLFVAHGDITSEVKEDGTIIDNANAIGMGGQDPDPVGIWSNGTQLMYISENQVYIDNGSGPLPAQFALSGTASAPGGTNAITRIDGDPFTGAAMAGKKIEFDGNDYQITGGVVDTAPPSVPGTVFVDRTVPATSEGSWWSPAGDPVTGVTGGFLDGYFIVNRAPPALPTDSPLQNRTFNISGLNDGLQWMPLDFGVKEGYPDSIRSILCDHEELWLFGFETTEVWTNVGSQVINGVASFPFQRIPGAFIHDGSSATYAPCSVGQYTCWLSGSSRGRTMAYRAMAFQPERISTHAQENEWNAPGFRVDDAVSYAMTDGGHLFWVLNFWQQGRTWVYDLTEGMWHERAGYDVASARFLKYQPWYHVFIPEWNGGVGRHIVGDPNSGNLYEMSLQFYDDDGLPIEYLRAFPHLIDEDKNMYHHRLEVYMESGTGNPNPLTVALDWSDDRGNTFVTVLPQADQNSGASTETTRRIVWRRLGRARDRVYRVGVLGQGKVSLIDTFLEASPGIY